MLVDWKISGPGRAEFVFEEPFGRLRLRVAALACGAVRVTRTLRDAFLNGKSDVVVDAAEGTCAWTQTADAFVGDCGGLAVRVDKAGGAVAFLSREGEILLREREKLPCVLAEKPVFRRAYREGTAVRRTSGVDGVRAEAEGGEAVHVRDAYEAKLSFCFGAREALYGLGSHEEGYGNLRGKSRALYQHNLKAVVPVLVSTRGWGILFDVGCAAAFHDDAEGSYFWADCADEMDYYLAAGGYAQVCRAYAALTGRAPMMPRYAFGYIQSKERYKDADELLAVAREYRRRGVPLDMIVQDWLTWPENQWGYKTLDRSRYPDPRALTDALHGMGVRLMISVWPSMQGDANADREQMLQNGCMMGNRTVYDAFSEKARALYWKQAEEGLFRYGVDAWWCDCTEPFEADWRGAIKPEPSARAEINTREAKRYLDPGKISLYSLMHAKGMYEGQRGATDAKRALILTRSSYAGQHRYAAATWSGDVSATWETLRRQVPEGMNFMATGEAYWSSDAGGFFPGGCGGMWFGAGDFERGVDDPGYRELYVRWLQFNAFLPLMRSHGAGTPREIWRFGEKGGVWYDAVEAAIRLRSRMLPFWYSLAAAYARDGLPMVYPPALAFPGDVALQGVDDEMLVGGALLVKPVARPMEYLPEGVKIARPDYAVPVYLPAGAAWYAWETGEAYAGGRTVRADAPLSAVPIFVRAGSVVPTGPVLQYADEDANPPLTVTVYPGADGAFTLYEDAGDGYGYERGERALIRFEWRDEEGVLTVRAREGAYPGMAAEKALRVRLAGGGETPIAYSGAEIAIRLKK